MKRILATISFFVLIFISSSLFAQENKPAEGGGKDNSKNSPKSERAKRKADKLKWKEARRKKRAEEKMIKEHHKRLQGKDLSTGKKVTKRMKQSKRKAQRNNDNKREFFLKRWFSRKS